MLQELIRTLTAVDTQPASKLFAAAGIDPAAIPSSLNIPRGRSWQRLIVWLLSLEENIPASAIPDVVDLYTSWSSGMLGLDPLTPLLLPWLYRWLTEIEAAHDAGPDAQRALLRGLNYEQENAWRLNSVRRFCCFATGRQSLLSSICNRNADAIAAATEPATS